MKRRKRDLLALLVAFITYLMGCFLWYFFWYKNGQTIHIVIVALIIGSIGVFIAVFKGPNIILNSKSEYKTLLCVLFIIAFVGFFGTINYLGNKRINYILRAGPTKHAIAVVTTVDIRRIRSGHQAWSIINYNADGEIIEQSFADTSNNLKVGKKYLIEYSLEHPDMFKVINSVK